MAPGYSHDEESQIPPWASQSMTPSQVQDFQARPSFTRSQPGQPFGFRIPSPATVSFGGTQSTKSHGSSCPSSHSSSVFSAPISHGTSSAPTSLAPSNCGSNSTYRTQGDEDSQLAPPRRSLQLHLSVAAENRASDAALQFSCPCSLWPALFLYPCPRSTASL